MKAIRDKRSKKSKGEVIHIVHFSTITHSLSFSLLTLFCFFSFSVVGFLMKSLMTKFKIYIHEQKRQPPIIFTIIPNKHNKCGMRKYIRVIRFVCFVHTYNFERKLLIFSFRFGRRQKAHIITN